MSNLSEVLDYAARGWSVFPLKPRSKEPAIRNGFYGATTNPATLRRWFGGDYAYNVGIRTGLTSRILVLDSDDGTSRRELESNYGALPETLTSSTGQLDAVGNPRLHLWFAIDTPIRISVGKVAPKIDIRADGGYAVAPPSIHPNGVAYRWLNDLPPAIPPDWLVRLAQQAKAMPGVQDKPTAYANYRRAETDSDAYGQAALDDEIRALSCVAKGARNDALNRASFSLHQLVAGGELDAGEVQDHLIKAAHANGLMTDPEDGPRKVIATIRSGARAGLQHPRNRRSRS